MSKKQLNLWTYYRGAGHWGRDSIEVLKRADSRLQVVQSHNRLRDLVVVPGCFIFRKTIGVPIAAVSTNSTANATTLYILICIILPLSKLLILEKIPMTVHSRQLIIA